MQHRKFAQTKDHKRRSIFFEQAFIFIYDPQTKAFSMLLKKTDGGVTMNKSMHTTTHSRNVEWKIN